MREIVKNYKIKLNKSGVPKGCVRIAFLTDLHNAVWNNDPEYLPSLIEMQQPDAVLCGGDMYIARPGRSVEYAARFLNRLAGEFPTFFARGNHEYRSDIYRETYFDMYDVFQDLVSGSGMITLVNSAADITLNGLPLQITGFEIPREYYRRIGRKYKTVPMDESILPPPDSSRISVLLAHNPKYASSYLRWGADLTLCGHYHGGIMRVGSDIGVISPELKLFTKFAHGHIEKNGKHVIISAGLGEHTLPLRINNPRELVMIDIENC